MRTSRKLEKPINWILDSKYIQINKIETNTHVWVPKLKPTELLTTVDPEVTLKNVIANMALLNTGSFHIHHSMDYVIARFVENDKMTLIVTEWYFPVADFNRMVFHLTYTNKIPVIVRDNETEEAVRESKFYTTKYEPI